MALETTCEGIITGQGRETVQHGTALFPIACYAEDVAQEAVAWHWHDDFEYILAETDGLTVGVGKTRLHLKRGQGVFINSGVLHMAEPGRPGPVLLHSGVFHPRLAGSMDSVFWQKLIKPLLQPDAPPCFLLDEAEPWQAQTLARLRAAWAAVGQEPEDYENETRFALCGALRLLTNHRPTSTARFSRQEQEAAARMKQMLHFIEEHAAEELTVERIAASVNLSESACLRSFRQLLGTTPIRYVRQCRVERAAELLLTTRLPAGEIGAECGFSDISYFTRTFREIKHCTPREYRRRFGPAREGAAQPKEAAL